MWNPGRRLATSGGNAAGNPWLRDDFDGMGMVRATHTRPWVFAPNFVGSSGPCSTKRRAGVATKTGKSRRTTTIVIRVFCVASDDCHEHYQNCHDKTCAPFSASCVHQRAMCRSAHRSCGTGPQQTCHRRGVRIFMLHARPFFNRRTSAPTTIMRKRACTRGAERKRDGRQRGDAQNA